MTKKRRKLRNNLRKKDIQFQKWFKKEYKYLLIISDDKPMKLKDYLYIKRKYPTILSFICAQQ